MSNLYKSTLASAGTAPTGDAVAADVLAGKTFSNASATGVTGTMVNNGAVSGTASLSQPYTIPAGYHNGSGVVTSEGSSTSFTPVGNAGNVIGTNLTVDMCYIVRVAGSGASAASVNGADVVSREVHPSAANNDCIFVRATATTASVGASGLTVSTLPIEISL